MVAFGDVVWLEEHLSRVHGQDVGAGNGGWPTIRFFNQGTGYGGQGYKQKTDEEVCEELGNEERMQQYVQEKSGTSMCDVMWGKDCNDMELKYINKWVGPEVQRNHESITAEKAKWEEELRKNPRRNFAQNKQRVSLLGRLSANFANPEL